MISTFSQAGDPHWCKQLETVRGQTLGGGRRKCCLQRPLLGGLSREQGGEVQAGRACSTITHSARGARHVLDMVEMYAE